MGALLRWNPFRELEQIARRWESLPRSFGEFEDKFDDVFAPAVESYVKDGNLIVRADVPGLEPKDIDVSILGNVLTVRGERGTSERSRRMNTSGAKFPTAPSSGA